MFCNHTTWRTHGRSLKIEDLQDVLLIEKIDNDAKLADIVYRIKTVIRLIFDMSTVYKMYYLEDFQLAKTFSVGTQPPLPISQNPSGTQQNTINIVELDIQCPKCGKKHKVKGYLDMDSAGIKQKGLETNVNIDENGVLICDSCHFALDLKPIKNQIETQTGKKVAFK